MKRLFPILVSLLFGWASAQAQEPRAEVTALWRGDEPATATSSGEVCLVRDADLTETDRLAVGDTLASGDQLKAGPCDGTATSNDELLLGLRCGGGTDIQLSGAFDLLILEPDAVDCAVDLTAGTADVLTDQPATITSGGITLGVEGTQFAVSREPPPPQDAADGADENGDESLFICRLFEGKLRVSHPTAEGQPESQEEEEFEGGRVWSWDGRRVGWHAVQLADVDATARRSARLDVARAFTRGQLATTPSAAVETLTLSHRTTLLEPKDSGARQELVNSLSRLGLDERATFERQRIESIRLDSRQLELRSPDSSNPQAESSSSSPATASGSRTLSEISVEIDRSAIDRSVADRAVVDRRVPTLNCRPTPVYSGRATQTIQLRTDQGIVMLELPARVAPGDLISGSLRLAALDRTSRDRLRRLESFQISLASGNLPVREGTWSVRMPRATSTQVELKDPRGRTQARLELRLSTAGPAERVFSPPCSCRAGAPFSIAGPFDGNLKTTQVTLGGQSARVLAESPREALVECNPQLTGERPLVVTKDRARHAVTDFRVVDP